MSTLHVFPINWRVQIQSSKSLWDTDHRMLSPLHRRHHLEQDCVLHAELPQHEPIGNPKQVHLLNKHNTKF